VIAIGFAFASLAGSGLLSLPIATETGEPAGFIDALFTATSAVCVTGLVTVDTGGHWSTFGELVIMGLFQIGGLGIMTLATLLVLLVTRRRLGRRTMLIAAAETRTLSVRDVARVVRNVALFTLVTETVVAVVLTARFALTYGMPIGTAGYHGVFHAISAFNNAGFSLNADSLMGYVADPWVSLAVVAAFVLGGLGFPVVFELARMWRRPERWSVVTRITVWTTVPLLVLGTMVLTAAEWSNPDTLGPLDGAGRLLAGFFAAATARTAGFNTIDTAAMTQEGWLATDLLMFIGGGSAGTAGGIKVTTFGLLAFVIWSELRGEHHVHVGHRRVPASTQRQALAVALLGVALVAVSTFALVSATDYGIDRVLFEAISAFGTVGLSTGITADLPDPAKLLIVALMFVGRVGPLTLFSALALREKTRRFELPEERTIVG
jgi:potassium uptake TrkH family protein